MSFWTEKGVVIAQWLGYKWTMPTGQHAKFCDPYWARNGKGENPPKYDCDAGAGVLLGELKKKGVSFLLDSNTPNNMWLITLFDNVGAGLTDTVERTTLHETVVDAILLLIKVSHE
jgi:hypothetical protein